MFSWFAPGQHAGRKESARRDSFTYSSGSLPGNTSQNKPPAPLLNIPKSTMDKLWSYFKNLFQQAEESSPSQPLIHEMIERSAEEWEDYQFWKETLVLRRLLNWLNEQYAIYRIRPDDIDEALDFLNTPSSKGFVVHFSQTGYSQRDVQHFFDFLKEQVLALKYRTQISDRRSYQRANWVETIERHYLKPGLSIRSNQEEDGRFVQHFGNIMIELEHRNDRVHNLRFRATTYNDSLFKAPAEFGELMQGVLS